MLEPGLSYEFRVTVEDELLTDVRGTLPVKVLSTPMMIALMEYASTSAVKDELDDGATTVGFEVCVKHVAAAFEGTGVTIRSELREIEDDRKLHFDVEVVESGVDERMIGIGTHQRRILRPPPE